MSSPVATSNIAANIVLIGAGKMGSALLEGWLGLGVDPKGITVVEPHPTPEISKLAARGLHLNPTALPSRTDAVVIAVKPQTAPEALAGIAGRIAPGAVVISIMAGRTLAFLEAALPASTAIVRAMPNTPAAIGRGITVAVPNAQVTPAQRDLAHRLLAATGAVEWVDDETLMDAVTAVSGSGPAYIFLLTESLARAGEKAGLPAALAANLARTTVAGAGELLHRSPLEPAALRHNVTSPGGTTAAALDVLTSPDGLDPLMERAIAAATRRSRELAG
jgi:pyrroline-5-carboxylate reductase